MIKKENPFYNIKSSISKQKNIVKEMDSLLNLQTSSGEGKMVDAHMNSLKQELRRENKNIQENLKQIYFKQKLPNSENIQNKNVPPTTLGTIPELPRKPTFTDDSSEELRELERATIKRIKKIQQIKKEKVKLKKPSKIIGLSNRLFSNVSDFFIKEGKFGAVQKDLIRSNMSYLPKSYISLSFFVTLISVFSALFLFSFFMLFNLGFTFPYITLANEEFLSRFLKIFWILILIPVGTFTFMYFFPSLEKRSVEDKINAELPFATINMAAISGSMIDPTKIFNIIIQTKEYPNLEKEFTKVINGINVLGYDLVTVLRNSSFNSPSKKLSDLFNGLATAIGSGGDLVKFFDERSKSLLFEYNLEKEKSTKAAETFMDIYISVVIAAPMILMLMLVIMQVSGLGISLSTGMITLIMVMGVSMINVAFLTFLHIRR